MRTHNFKRFLVLAFMSNDWEGEIKKKKKRKHVQVSDESEINPEEEVFLTLISVKLVWDNTRIFAILKAT